jgi:hypothetical protein
MNPEMPIILSREETDELRAITQELHQRFLTNSRHKAYDSDADMVLPTLIADLNAGKRGVLTFLADAMEDAGRPFAVQMRAAAQSDWQVYLGGSMNHLKPCWFCAGRNVTGLTHGSWLPYDLWNALGGFSKIEQGCKIYRDVYTAYLFLGSALGSQQKALARSRRKSYDPEALEAIDALIADLNAGNIQVLGILADSLEDTNHPDARAIRAAQRSGRSPMLPDVGLSYIAWADADQSTYTQEQVPWVVPGAVYHALGAFTDKGGLTKLYSTIYHAYLALGNALL